MRSTVEYRGRDHIRPISIIIDAHPPDPAITNTGTVMLRTIDGGHIADLSPIEARHFAAQLVAAAEVAAS